MQTDALREIEKSKSSARAISLTIDDHFLMYWLQHRSVYVYLNSTIALFILSANQAKHTRDEEEEEEETKICAGVAHEESDRETEDTQREKDTHRRIADGWNDGEKIGPAT